MTEYKNLQKQYNLIREEILENISILNGVMIDDFKISPKDNKRFTDAGIYTFKDLIALDGSEINKVLGGSITALKKLIAILQMNFLNKNISSKYIKPNNLLTAIFKELDNVSDEFLNFPISYKYCSARLTNIFLVSNNIVTYGDLKTFGICNVASLKNLGVKTIREFKNIFDSDKETFLQTNLTSMYKTNSVRTENSSYTIFVEKLKTIFNDATLPQNGCNGKDYSILNRQLCNMLLNHGSIFLTERQKNIFKMRMDYDSPQTLQVVANSFSLTRERIRQICMKCESKIIKRYLFGVKNIGDNEVEAFYDELNKIDEQELIYYLSYSKFKGNLDWALLKAIIKTNSCLDKVPEYDISKYSLDYKIKKLDEINDLNFKSLINNVNNFKLSKTERSLICCLDECLKQSDRVDYDFLLSYANGSKKDIQQLANYGCCTKITMKDVTNLIRIFSGLKLVSRHRISRGYYYLKLNYRLCYETNLLIQESEEQIDKLSSIDLIILKCISSINGNYGIQMLCGVLLGSQNERIKNNGLFRNDYYCKLRSIVSKGELIENIEKLIANGFVKKSNSIYPCLFLTEKGAQFVK